jgi:hypothetical protein
MSTSTGYNEPPVILGQGRTKTSDGSNRSYGLLHEWTRVLTMMTTGGGAQCVVWRLRGSGDAGCSSGGTCRVPTGDPVT